MGKDNFDEKQWDRETEEKKTQQTFRPEAIDEQQQQ